MKLPAPIVKRLRVVLADMASLVDLDRPTAHDIDVVASTAREAKHLLGKLSPPKRLKQPLPGKSRSVMRREKVQKHAEETRKIREAAGTRALGHCENCNAHVGETNMELDHHLGGVGRRRQRQSVETCWFLCHRCHRDKTENRPTRETWERQFVAHCERHGYEVPRRHQ